jgi:hypothetical protein
MFANLLAKAGVAALVAAFTSYAETLPEISITGSKFYDPDGNQFFIKGMIMSFPWPSSLANFLFQALHTN